MLPSGADPSPCGPAGSGCRWRNVSVSFSISRAAGLGERQALLPLATAEDNFANHLTAQGQQLVDRVTLVGAK
jgi:hypothetical protein